MKNCGFFETSCRNGVSSTVMAVCSLRLPLWFCNSGIFEIGELCGDVGCDVPWLQWLAFF